MSRRVSMRYDGRMRILTVTEFLSGVNDVLAGVPAAVEGEVSGFVVRQDRWVFFSLKDDASVVECFMPVWKLRHAIEDGMLVRVAGVSGIYTKTGRFRITVEALEPAGEGSLKRAFELLRQKLEHEGLFAQERKRALPRFPEVIGLIASGESAAYSDFLRILKNRWGGVRVLLADVSVQGDGAVRDIVRALGIGHWSLVIPNVLVLTRGGGSLEDLAAFNSEEVARAIFASPIPVVVGVGHERDVTIADLVADVRASTPSNAAERVVPDRRDVANEIVAMVDTIGASLETRRATARHRLEQFVATGTAFARRRRERVESSAAVLASRAAAWRTRAAARLDAAARLIANLNPTRLLARGYSMTTIRGRIVRDASTLHAGDQLTTRFAAGHAESTVNTVSTPRRVQQSMLQ
ncbi:exodeoxyribonuclease VII large subunit [Candidatus Uhrbacteria bacterium]|nr:exodeoxyribonuclease VII large subunit [Candidatus Uhrbacteria bacterium]